MNERAPVPTSEPCFLAGETFAGWHSCWASFEYFERAAVMAFTPVNCTESSCLASAGVLLFVFLLFAQSLSSY